MNLMIKIFFLLMLFAHNLQATEKTLEIRQITPHGDLSENIKNPNQIIVEFNLPMIPLGDINHEIKLPITITPEINCNWQWINVNKALCPIADNILQYSTNYQIKIDSEFTTFDGVKLNKEYNAQFTTVKPKIIHYKIIDWKNASTPIFQLEFNQFIIQDSNIENIYILEEDTNRKFKIHLLNEEEYSSKEDWIYREKELSDFLKLHPYDIPAKNIKKTIFIEPISILEEGKKFKLMLNSNLTSAHGNEKWTEDHEILTFETFDKPQFLGIKCLAFNPELNQKPNNQNPYIIILPNEIDNELNKKCMPESAISLLFNSPVKTEQIFKYFNFNPELSDKIKYAQNYFNEHPEQMIKFDSNYWQPSPYIYEIRLGGQDDFIPNQKYKISYSKNKNNILDAALNFILKISKKNTNYELLNDYFGRPFISEFIINFTMGDKIPKYELINNRKINLLQPHQTDDLILKTQNIVSYDLQYSLINTDHKEKNKITHKLLDNKINESIETKLDLRKILNNQDGLLIGKLLMKPLDRNYEDFTENFLVQISNYNIVAKMGHYNSLIWVTDIENKEPIANARVIIKKVKIDDFLNGNNIVTSGITDANGLVILDGLVKLNLNIEDQDKEQFIIEVKKENNLGWLLINNSVNGIYLNNMSTNLEKKSGHIVAHGFTSNKIYRAGEKINYKFYVRNNENKMLRRIDNLVYDLSIVNPEGKIIIEEKNIKLSKFGSYDGQYILEGNASSGTYYINLTDVSNKSQDKLKVTEFIISDTSKASFQLDMKLNKEFILYQDEIIIANHAELYAGGSYNNSDIILNISLNPENFSPQLPLAHNFEFNDNLIKIPSRIFHTENKLDNSGNFNTKTTVNNDKIPYGQIEIETIARENNGGDVVTKTNLPYYGANQFIGLKANKWLYQLGEKQIIELIALDGLENIIDNLGVEIKIEEINALDNSLKLIDSCKVKTKKEITNCIFNIKAIGNYQATSIINGQNKSIISFTITNDNNIINNSTNPIIEIIPEKTNYQLNEIAHFMVKNPFPGTEVLITIERYGVIEQFIKKLDQAIEMIDINLNKEEYAPGFYLSIALPHHPLNKFGCAKIFIENPYNKIKLDLASEKETYKPGEEAILKLSLDDGNQADEVEVTILAVDQALLDLQVNSDKNYFDLRQKFNQLQPLDMLNLSSFSPIYQFEPRMAYASFSHNGGLSAANKIRNDFKNLAFYQTNLIVKKNEIKEVKFNLPDDLTQWRIIAISADKDSLFGLNETSLKVNKATEIRPLFPTHLLTGDELIGAFTIFNRTDQERLIKYEIKAEGPLNDKIHSLMQEKEIILNPMERKIIEFSLKVMDELQKEYESIKINIKAGDHLDDDQLETSIKVARAVITEVSVEDRVITAKKFNSSLEPSLQIIGKLSSLQINISNTILANLESIFNYAKNLEPTNWEQKLSKLFTATRYHLLTEKLNNEQTKIFNDFEWSHISQMIEDNLKEISKYQTAQGGLSYYENGIDDPYLSATTLWALNKIAASDNLSDNIKEKLMNYLQSLPKLEKNLDLKTLIFEVLNMDKSNNNNIKEMEKYWPEMTLFAKGKTLNSLINNTDYQEQDLNLIGKWWSDLLNYAHHDGSFISFNEKNKSILPFNIHQSNNINNCIMLELALNLKNKVPNLIEIDFISGLVNNILNRNKNKNYNSHEVMICSNALVQYNLEYEKLDEIDDATLTIQTIGRQAEVSEEIEIPNYIEIDDLSRFIGQKTLITITKDKEYKNLYFSAKLAATMNPDFKNEINKGIGIKRSYRVKLNNNEDKWIDLKDHNLNIGDMIKISLKIHAPSDLHFVHLKDYIPGCFAPIDQNLRQYNNQKSFNFNHIDINKNYAQFYAEFLPAGEYNIDYYAQIVAKGEYNILPAKINETYNEEIYGQTIAEKIIFKLDEAV